MRRWTLGIVVAGLMVASCGATATGSGGDGQATADGAAAHGGGDAGSTGSGTGDGGETTTDSGPLGPPLRPGALDLLIEIDNSNSMRDNQSMLLDNVGAMLQSLVAPPCVSTAVPLPHACDPSNPADQLQYAAVTDLHVGVISQDLGTPGSTVPGCVNPQLGDDGVLNPIRNGGALETHEPWVGAPASYGRPADCTDPNQFPSFLSYTSADSLPGLEHDIRCNAGLYVNGCGLEQQLEAIYRALIVHDARSEPGNTSPNAGFLRDDALLAILVLTDEEDGSIRPDALDVFNAASTAWSDANLNMRDYMYQPGSAQDPTYSLDRYVDPKHPNVGLLSLKPGHPERIVFTAIAGVPLDFPIATSAGGYTHPDWDALLGAPDSADPDNFAGRDSHTAIAGMSAEGPISMLQANMDATCAPDTRVVPACRRRGSTPVSGDCTTTGQYFAWPSRRVVEIARRFDQSALCNGAACNNGSVQSICEANYGSVISAVIRRIQTRVGS